MDFWGTVFPYKNKIFFCRIFVTSRGQSWTRSVRKHGGVTARLHPLPKASSFTTLLVCPIVIRDQGSTMLLSPIRTTFFCGFRNASKGFQHSHVSSSLATLAKRCTAWKRSHGTVLQAKLTSCRYLGHDISELSEIRTQCLLTDHIMLFDSSIFLSTCTHVRM